MKWSFPLTWASGGLPLGGPVCAGTDAAETEPEHLPPAAAKFENAHELGRGWGVEHRPSWGRDNSRGRLVGSTYEFAYPQSDVAVNHITQHCMSFKDRQHTVVAEGSCTQAHDRHGKRVGKGPRALTRARHERWSANPDKRPTERIATTANLIKSRLSSTMSECPMGPSTRGP